MRRLAQEQGIKPEFEIFHAGQFWLMEHVLAAGLATEPYWVQLVMGVQNGNFPTPMDVLDLVNALPDGSLFSVIGVGPHQLPLTTLSILLGGHVRVGMEDNVYFRRGEKATSNAQFVERVVQIAGALGREIATPADAREMLGISPVPSTYSENRLRELEAQRAAAPAR